MDILDILLDILLKPPQPFIGLFLRLAKDDNMNDEPSGIPENIWPLSKIWRY